MSRARQLIEGEGPKEFLNRQAFSAHPAVAQAIKQFSAEFIEAVEHAKRSGALENPEDVYDRGYLAAIASIVTDRQLSIPGSKWAKKELQPFV